jgi:hypothetical protein
VRKEAILLLQKKGKTLVQYSHKLSIISKQSRLMLTKLRYQVKIHTLSDKPRENNPANSPHIYIYIYIYIYLKKENKENKENMQYGNDIICKGKIKPVDAR